MSDPSPPTLTV